MSTVSLVSTAEYLRTSYRPDRELIDGELKERPMPSRLHGYVQMLIGTWFHNHKKEWKVAAESEARTEVRRDRFRLPDVSITRLGTLSGRVQQSPPLIAIEILSDDDRFVDLERRAVDLAEMGVRHVWLLDPDQQRAWVWAGLEGWTPFRDALNADDGMYLDLAWLWAEISEHREKGVG